jgi:hypothetical protein
MPALTKFYGIFPWQLEQFTADELREYARQFNDYQQQRELEQRRARR